MARAWFMQNYGVKAEDVFEIHNQTQQGSMDAYRQLFKLLRQSSTRTLFVHIMTGHGVQYRGQQTLLVNEEHIWSKEATQNGRKRTYKDYNHFYRRFGAEAEIRSLAIQFTHSYHLGVFVCCRELEKKEYNYYTRSEAWRILQETVRAYETKTKVSILDQQRTYNPAKLEDALDPAIGEEVKQQELGRGRDALASPLQCSNFAMIYGTKPQTIPGQATKMLSSLFENILNKQDKVTLSVEFPGVLSQIRTDDANFELSLSNTIQKLTLYAKESTHKPLMTQFTNTVGKSIGVVFINNSSQGKLYRPGNYVDPRLNNRTHALSVDQELEATLGMFHDLRIVDVRTIEDRSKEDIITEFERLRQEAVDYENNHIAKEVLTIFVRWIGFDFVGADFAASVGLLEGADCRVVKFAEQEYAFKRHGLTVEGQPVCVDDYCLWLANVPSCHVVLIQDQSAKNAVLEGDVDWSEGLHELKLTETHGLQRFSSYHSRPPAIHLQLKELNRLVKEAGQPVFYIPDVFYTPEFGADRAAWMTKSIDRRITFDLRNEGQKRNEFQTDISFKKELDLWEDKPQIVASEEVSVGSGSNSVVYHLPQQQQIMHVIQKSSEPSVLFEFYDDTPPFAKKQIQFEVPVSGEAKSLVMTDLRSPQD